jgi:hypothetical protein
MARIVPLSSTRSGARAPLKITAVVPVNPDPRMTTLTLRMPPAGVKLVIAAGRTTNEVVLFPVP